MRPQSCCLRSWGQNDPFFRASGIPFHRQLPFKRDVNHPDRCSFVLFDPIAAGKQLCGLLGHLAFPGIDLGWMQPHADTASCGTVSSARIAAKATFVSHEQLV